MLNVVFPALLLGQEATSPPPVTFTAEQDHQNMMDQLGIRSLREGPSGDEKAANLANYDESKANPYPNLPDALTLRDGKKVLTAGCGGVSGGLNLLRSLAVKFTGECWSIRRM